MSGFGIYVHWPFCAAKCPYCDFNSHVRERFDNKRWARAIASELRAVAEMQKNPPPERGRPTRDSGSGGGQSVSSIFFGGGTPSLMSGGAVASVLDAIASNWCVGDDVEITLEANPNSVEQDRFRDYRAAGVNRVSIGVQALDDRALKSLGRLHGADEARAAVRLALNLFPRASFDLIYARPDQSISTWRKELKEALSFGAEHLSLYQLTIEPGTAYASLARQGKLVIPDEDVAAELYEVTQEFCEKAGLPAYEVSNHARHSAECRHNLIYWRYGDYAGVGPGAHGRLTLGPRRVATEAERLPERWFAAVEANGSSLAMNDIAHEDAAREHLLMGLRLSEGIDLAAYKKRWGRAPDEARIRDLAGFVTLDNGRLRVTAKGRLVLNRVIAELAAAPESVP
ncbi:MAG TPA: radical SAM family heme chaperone HemW [Micropepsaceae bacterium]|nr:radical SAM family heme chaperone HemW [Micropepsaceae bacterium]